MQKLKLLQTSVGIFLLIAIIGTCVENTEKHIYLPTIKRDYVGLTFGSLAIILAFWCIQTPFFKQRNYLLAEQFIRYPLWISLILGLISIAILSRKASFFWLILPILLFTILTYLAYRYEKIKENTYKTWLSLPLNNDQKPTWNTRITSYILVFVSWILLYELVIYRGLLPNSLDTYFSFEYEWKVVEWAEIFYISAYLYPVIIPLVLRKNYDLRQFVIAGMLLVSIGIFLQMCLPFIATPRPFEPQTFWGELLAWERKKDGLVAALPSYHVAWAFFAAYFYEKSIPRFTFFFYAWAVLISLSCMAVGMHSLVDVLTGILLVLACVNYDFWKIHAQKWHKLVLKKRWYSSFLDNTLNNYFLYLQLFLVATGLIFSIFWEDFFWNFWLKINLLLAFLQLFLLTFTYQNEATRWWDLLHHGLHLPLVLLLYVLYFYQIYSPVILAIYFIGKALLLFLNNHTYKKIALQHVSTYYKARVGLLYLLGVFCLLC
ncbi:MAG: phosphatase PAP2 family protein [Microscillaceae bacterium]|nr:phosphatase PAP2 family protein [Microscillaceae bacterium]MDW8461172.1 phosphatase PAP2 family protein [Cytophagales bacterium]